MQNQAGEELARTTKSCRTCIHEHNCTIRAQWPGAVAFGMRERLGKSVMPMPCSGAYHEFPQPKGRKEALLGIADSLLDTGGITPSARDTDERTGLPR